MKQCSDLTFVPGPLNEMNMGVERLLDLVGKMIWNFDAAPPFCQVWSDHSMANVAH